MQLKFLKTPVVILKTYPRQEFDLEILALTPEHGCLRIKAPGARKPKAKLKCIGSLGSVLCVELVQGKHSFTLRGAKLTKNRQTLAQDYTRFCLAMELLSLTSKNLKDQDPHPEVFDHLNTGLDQILICPNPHLTCAATELKILSALGLLSELNVCTVCGKKISPHHIHLAPNGFSCEACEQAQHAEETAAKALYFFQKNPLTRASSLTLTPSQTQTLQIPLSLWCQALN